MKIENQDIRMNFPRGSSNEHAERDGRLRDLSRYAHVATALSRSCESCDSSWCAAVHQGAQLAASRRRLLSFQELCGPLCTRACSIRCSRL